jgi:hypothetical protein
MCGGSDPPKLDFRSHELPIREQDVSFDIDSLLAVATCVAAVRGLSMLFFPAYVRNIRRNLHQRFRGCYIHNTPYIYLGSALSSSEFAVYVVFLFINWNNRQGTFPPQTICAR